MLITLRWRGPINIWESLYILPAAIGVGLLNSSQFIALSLAVEKSQLPTSIGMFFLSQQLGMMVGASVSAVILTSVFRDGLRKALGNDERSMHVGAIESPTLCVAADFCGLHQLIDNIMSSRRTSNFLPQPLRDDVMSSYLGGFHAVASKS